MKKYMLFGLVAGTALSFFLLFLRKKKYEGMEFHDFVRSASEADDLFGKAFCELPDKP